MVIAIDGPAGAGKSTVARALARRLGWTYLDTGAMYRCVALAALEAGLSPADPDALGTLAAGLEISFGPERDGRPTVGLHGRDVTLAIRDSEVTAAASEISVHAPVREALVGQQRRLIAAGRFVAEGRDIGTVVSPEAPLKIFLTADEEERARRRAAESDQSPEQVLLQQRKRDQRDSSRQHGALRPADDAIELDTTGLRLELVVERIVNLADERGLTATGEPG